MTSKQKAEELYNKMIVDFTIDKWQSKQCALVAVDEILDNCYEVMKPFWLEVKQEIESL